MFANMDAAMLPVVRRWLHECCGVPGDDLVYAVQIHQSADVAAALRYRSAVLGVPSAELRVYLKRHNPWPKRGHTGNGYLWYDTDVGPTEHRVEPPHRRVDRRVGNVLRGRLRGGRDALNVQVQVRVLSPQPRGKIVQTGGSAFPLRPEHATATSTGPQRRGGSNFRRQ